jgi:WXXGXW repeat (2 copies)
MIKYGLPVAVAALILAAPAAKAQLAQPVPLPPPNFGVTSATATITGQPQPAPEDFAAPGYAQPMIMVPYGRPISPRTVWIPSHFDWDPARSYYVYIEGQYVEAPRENAQWIPGHWAETPTAWIWIDGTWN